MDNPRRHRITLTQWLLIVIVAALVSNAALQTISIVQHNESARMKAVQRSPNNAQVAQAYQKLLREVDDNVREARRTLNESERDLSEPDGEMAPEEERSGPTNSNMRRIERLPNRTAQ